MIETRHFTGVFSSVLTIIFELLVILSVILLLLSIQFKITLITLAIILAIMLLYHKLVSKTLGRWGSIREEFSTKSLKSLNEIFGGIKTIKIFNVEKIFSGIFSKHITTFSSTASKHSAFLNYPRIVLEMSAIFIIFSILILLSYSDTDLKNIIPFFGVFAVSAFRLLPSASKLMQSFNNISFYKSSVEMMEKEYNKPQTKIDDEIGQEIIFEREIRLKNINFSHNQKDNIYEKENLNIKKFDCVGIFGESGVGKTTLVDIIMGLYKPDKGHLLIDEKKIVNQNEIQSWQKKISYVPQSIFLFNGSIKNNVSFEFDNNLIDEKKVSQSLVSSQLEKFANQNEKLNYVINEGGGNLSIGEKQRVGIARALYKNPELIILDEPTSALDKNTAKNFINFLGEFRKKRTLIIISHDLNSLQFCDKIYEVTKNERTNNKIILRDSHN